MNVKPGDLAIVVAPHPFAGATCTVLRDCNHVMPAFMLQAEGHHWECEFPRPMPWAVLAPNNTPLTHGAMPDAKLRKLTGPDVKGDDLLVEIPPEVTA